MRIINNKLHEDIVLPNTTYCPYCGGEMNIGSSCINGDVQDGDFGICVGCAGVSISIISNGVHSLREATNGDIVRAKIGGIYNMIVQYQNMLRNTNHGLTVKK